MKFDISNNMLCAQGTKAIADALKNNQTIIELNLAENYSGLNNVPWEDGSADMSGVIAISDAIPTMGALTSLNLASNCFGAEGAKHIAEAIKMNVSAPQFMISF